MAFKFALIAAAAASRIARQADSENERLIKECRDTRPWLSCIGAYASGECIRGDGCDRTCGMCRTDAATTVSQCHTSRCTKIEPQLVPCGQHSPIETEKTRSLDE